MGGPWGKLLRRARFTAESEATLITDLIAIDLLFLKQKNPTSFTHLVLNRI